MNDERERCLELLGLKPGAAAQEIKAAYRDLAKVWHPDRFAHDPRLQQKAQDKLKEINEAYEALISGRFRPRSDRAARSSNEAPAPPAPPSRSQHGNKHLSSLMILLACAVIAAFFVSARLLPGDRGEEKQLSVTSQPVRDEESDGDEAAVNRQEKKSVEKQKAPASSSIPAAAESRAPVRAIPTVTVTIDPTTGLLATAACPIKSSMTYVGGQEPRQHCGADHRPASAATAPTDSKNRSRLKSAFNRMAAPARWLEDKTKEAGQDN